MSAAGAEHTQNEGGLQKARLQPLRAGAESETRTENIRAQRTPDHLTSRAVLGGLLEEGKDVRDKLR